MNDHPEPIEASLSERPETIYLLDMGGEAVWCDQPDPDYDDRSPVRYVRADVAEAKLEAARQEAAQSGQQREALEWYAEQVWGCRIIGDRGNKFRHALDHDGGERAREALKLEATAGTGENDV